MTEATAVRGVARHHLRAGVCTVAIGIAVMAQPTAQPQHPQPADRDRLLEEAGAHESKAIALSDAGAFEAALGEAQQALHVRERLLGADDPAVARSLNALGRVYAARNRDTQAEELFRHALAIVEKRLGAEDPAVAEILDGLAMNASSQTRYAEAEQLATRALAIRTARLGENDPSTAASIGTLADVYIESAKYAEGRDAANRALAIAANIYRPDDPAYGDFLARVGRVAPKLGDYARAEQIARQVLDIREKTAGKDSLQYGRAVAALGRVYFYRGDNNVAAEENYERAIVIEEKFAGPDYLPIAFILNDMGLLSLRGGDYGTAEARLTRSLAITEKVRGPDHPDAAYPMNNLGLVYWRQRNYAKAADFYQRTLELIEKSYGPESAEAAPSVANLGIIYKETGNYERAEPDYRRALAIREKTLGKDHQQVADMYDSLGILYRDRGDYDRAEPTFRRALDITERSLGADHPSFARELDNLGQLYAARGDAANALDILRRVSAIDERQMPLNLAAGSERQKLAYFTPFAVRLDKLLSFHVREAPGNRGARDLAATALLQRKGRVLDAMADGLGALRRRSSPEDLAVLDDMDRATSEAARLALNGPQRTSLSDYQQRITTLLGERERLEIELARRSAGYYERPDAVTFGAVQAAVPVDAALIEFAVYRPFDPKASVESGKAFDAPRYLAYVIRHDGEVGWADLGAASEIDRAVAALRETLRDPTRTDVGARARALDARILEPIRPMTNGATRLLVSPDGQLDLVPFEALRDEQGRYLVERFAITYLTAGRDVLRMQVARAPKSAGVIVADPSFGEPRPSGGSSGIQPGTRVATHAPARRSITTGPDLEAVYFSPLAGTLEEARSIKQLFPDATILTGTQASQRAIKSVDAPSILHIATHGFFLQDQKIANPLLRSGLALSGANLSGGSAGNGVLTALEASSLNLWGTKLVTLSACDTGIGEVHNGEGVFGLRRAFFLAGAETLVMSLWPVSDYVTREMMTAYYGGLKRGLGRSDALRQAQLAMRARPNRAHPFYWASFIQAGEWANLEGRR